MSGHMRSYKYTFQRLRFNLLKRYEGSVDLFVSTWEESETEEETKYRKDTEEKEIITKENLEAAYDRYLKKYNIEDFQEIYDTKIKSPLYENKHPMITKMACMWYKIQDSWQLMTKHAIENNIKYDIIVRIRPDVKIFKFEDVDFLNNSSQSLPIILMPNTQRFGGYNDQFFLGSEKTMNKIMNLYTHYNNYIKTNELELGSWAEELMKFHMEKNKCEIMTVSPSKLHYTLFRPPTRDKTVYDEKLDYK